MPQPHKKFFYSFYKGKHNNILLLYAEPSSKSIMYTVYSTDAAGTLTELSDSIYNENYNNM